MAAPSSVHRSGATAVCRWIRTYKRSVARAGVDALPLPFRAFLRVRLGIAARRNARIHLLPRPLAVTMWCAGLNPEDTDLVLRRRCPEAAGIPLEATPDHFPHGDTSAYIVLDRDRAIRSRSQHKMAANLRIANTCRIDAGHEVMLSHPELLADQLNLIAHTVLTTGSELEP